MKIEELTFFRFLAASIVVIFHFGRKPTGLTGVLISGQEMVTFFFVLSGFVMGIAYFKKGITVHKYLWARVSRIMPVYLLALLLTSILLINDGKDIDSTSLFLHLTLLQSWISPHPMTLNIPGWSISAEAFFYLSFPFILYSIKKYSISSINIAMLASLLWLVTHIITTVVISTDIYTGDPKYIHEKIHYFPLTHLCSFLFGIAGAIWMHETKHTKYNKNLLLSLLIMTFTAIIMLLNNTQHITDNIELELAFGSSLLSPLFLLFIVLIALSRSKIISTFRLYPFILLGEASYALYILQLPVYLIYNEYISDIFSLDPAMNFYMFFLFLTVISILTFLLFEKPTNKFLRYTLPLFIQSVRRKILKKRVIKMRAHP